MQCPELRQILRRQFAAANDPIEPLLAQPHRLNLQSDQAVGRTRAEQIRHFIEIEIFDALPIHCADQITGMHDAPCRWRAGVHMGDLEWAAGTRLGKPKPDAAVESALHSKPA